MIKVLVIDDSESELEVIKAALSASNLDYEIVSDSRLALEVAKKYQPDIILLDLCMPNMTGHEVLKAIRTDPETSNTEVVQITASGNVGDFLTSVRLHIADYILKPISIPALIDSILKISVAKKMRKCTSEFKNKSQLLAEKYAA